MSNSSNQACTTQFKSVTFRGNASWGALADSGLSDRMAGSAADACQGQCVFWGLPFRIGTRPVAIVEGGRSVTVELPSVRAQWLVFAHTSDLSPLEANADGFFSPTTGWGHLAEHAANYMLIYADGSQRRAKIKRRHQIGAVRRNWGENCVQAVAHGKVRPIPAAHKQLVMGWGRSQTLASANDSPGWTHWLWAWKNPRPGKTVVAVRFEPVSGGIVVAGISAGKASSNPLRWRSRRKAVLRLPRGVEFDRTLDTNGELAQVSLDMGVVISAEPRTAYPDKQWTETYNNALPELPSGELIVEYTSHLDATFSLVGGRKVPAARLERKKPAGPLQAVRPANREVTLRVVEKGSTTPVPVKLHVHGSAGEYLAPMDRHRYPNGSWFEDYSSDFLHQDVHICTYIPGETRLKLPLGKVYIEVSKGFEIRPVRKVVSVNRSTEEIVIRIERALPWRRRGWVSADTHVHFLSPTTGLLEGAGEGVNVVNLLASQWGELMTNVGDFDGRTTHGSREAGGDGEYLLRVGTENRQHVLGHISLLGYEGNIIAPMCSAGPDEAALGDPVEVLLTEWAAQCKKQNGLVVLPHFPNPRMEGAAAIVSGNIDAVEMTSWGNLYGGLSPYSLSDWYRYLNNGYMLAAVGGTDKMTATTAVGAVRTYARITDNRRFTYASWKDAVRRCETFVTYGPLLEFEVEGKAMGSRISMGASGGTVDVTWKVASVTVPISKVDLVANGEIIESRSVDPSRAQGHFKVKVHKSTWLALLVRGHYADKPEIIAAHSSPVMVSVKGTHFHNAADALTILDQIEGSLAYIDTVGTRAETKAYRRIKMVLTAAHRQLHNRMHTGGVYHQHSTTEDHKEHH